MTRPELVHIAVSCILISQTSCVLGDRTRTVSTLRAPSSDLRESFHELRIQQVQNALPRHLRERLVPLVDPAHSRFPYWYVNDDQLFNQYTYEYISARVMPGPIPGSVQLSEANGFTNATIQLMSDIGYSLGSDDRAAMHDLQQQLGKHEIAVVQVYEQVYNIITDGQVLVANEALQRYGVEIPTKLDYVILYIMGYIWSGHDSASAPPLSFTQIVDAPDLDTLFPDMPASGAAVMPALGLFLESHRNARVIQNSLQYNSWALAEALGNAKNPTSITGGIKTFDPLDGCVSADYHVAYGIGISLAEIHNGLADLTRAIRLEFDFHTGEPDSSLKHQLALRDMLSIIGPSGGLMELPGLLPGGGGTLSVIYQGHVYVPITRADWSPNTGEGWYYDAPIFQAATDADRTGYSFYVDPPAQLVARPGDANKLGLLTGVFLTNSPTVTLSYDCMDGSQAEAFDAWLEGEKVVLSGEALLGSVERLYTPEILDDPSSPRCSIAFAPIERAVDSEVGEPLAMRMADVLSVSVSYLGDQ